MADPSSPRQKFIALVEEVCRSSKVPLPKVQQADTQPLHLPVEVDHVHFEFFHPIPDQPGFLVKAQFGLPAAAQKGDVYRRALMINSLLSRAHVPGFGLDKDSGQLIYVMKDLFGRIAPTELSSALKQIAASAAEWRNAKLVTA